MRGVRASKAVRDTRSNTSLRIRINRKIQARPYWTFLARKWERIIWSFLICIVRSDIIHTEKQRSCKQGKISNENWREKMQYGIKNLRCQTIYDIIVCSKEQNRGLASPHAADLLTFVLEISLSKFSWCPD